MKNFISLGKSKKKNKIIVAFVILGIIYLFNMNNSYGTVTSDSEGTPPSNYVSEPDIKLTDYGNAPDEVNSLNGLKLFDETNPRSSNVEILEHYMCGDPYAYPYEEGYTVMEIPSNLIGEEGNPELYRNERGEVTQNNGISRIKVKYDRIGTMTNKATNEEIPIGCIMEFRDFYLYTRNLSDETKSQRDEQINIRVHDKFKKRLLLSGYSIC